MNFPGNVYLLAIAAACATSAISLPFWRKWCLRVGLMDEPGERKIHSEPIPLAGGFAVLAGLMVPTVAASLLLWILSGTQSAILIRHWFPAGFLDEGSVMLLIHGLGVRSIRLAGILAGALGMLIVGWLDDKHELQPRAKFAGQLLIAFVVAASGVRITLFVHNLFFSYAITMLWILTVINAFNFMDNMNGLCAGLGAIGAWYFAIIAAAEGQYLVALIAFLTFGALLGFLPFNFPRARAFLGDSGSHLVGYLLAVLAILPHFYNPRHPRHLAVLTPLLVMAVPLIDMGWVVLLRLRKGQPFYKGDNNHLSHRLVRAGLSPTTAVLVIWIVAGVLGACVCFF
jgi:UDP-GlcNAc:undecaprenyl-phosphate/decaprenyl-phosphate GlcNAc-1-phosphate transferase